MRPILYRILKSPAFALTLAVAICTVGLTALVFADDLSQLLPHHAVATAAIAADPLWRVARLRFYITFFGLLLASLCASRARFASVDARVAQGGRLAFLIAAGVVSLGMAFFVLHYGRLQFGSYDFDIVTDLGWRTSLGQVPLREFVTYMPPGFIFGIKYAFVAFGPYWNSNLYAAAILAVVSFWWMSWLLRSVGLSRPYAILLSSSVEAAAMISLCFWWYNNTATIAAAIFFLSCIACAKHSRTVLAELSLALSVSIAVLMKPNVTGVALLLGLLPLLALGARRWRLVSAVFGGLGLASLILLSQKMPPLAVFAANKAIAADRGGLSRFGFNQLTRTDKELTLLWLFTLSVPLLTLFPKLLALVRRREIEGVTIPLILLGAPLVAVYSVMTNGEWRDVDCTTLLLAFGFMFTMKQVRSRLLPAYLGVSLLIATLGADVAYGMQRERVYTIGLHTFFEWGPLERVENGFFEGMSVGNSLIKVNSQIARVANTLPRPIFFGPRLMSQYAAIREPSPTGNFLFWEPGTAFPKNQASARLQLWRTMRFPTLVFLRDDYTYYTPEFLAVLKTDYVRDDSQSAITIYRLRQ